MLPFAGQQCPGADRGNGDLHPGRSFSSRGSNNRTNKLTGDNIVDACWDLESIRELIGLSRHCSTKPPLTTYHKRLHLSNKTPPKWPAHPSVPPVHPAPHHQEKLQQLCRGTYSHTRYTQRVTSPSSSRKDPEINTNLGEQIENQQQLCQGTSSHARSTQRVTLFLSASFKVPRFNTNIGEQTPANQQ